VQADPDLTERFAARMLGFGNDARASHTITSEREVINGQQPVVGDGNTTVSIQPTL
jgi:hypothetical protein